MKTAELIAAILAAPRQGFRLTAHQPDGMFRARCESCAWSSIVDSATRTVRRGEHHVAALHPAVQPGPRELQPIRIVKGAA